jgi:hypothetical protein
MGNAIVLDCEEGRRLGCASFCCRLIVRLQLGEQCPGQPDSPLKHCIDKNPKTGLCVYLDPADNLCTIWGQRPQICREYDCNKDPLLQVVLKCGFWSLTHLAFADPSDYGRSGCVAYQHT